MGITNRINFRHVRGDMFGGVTAAVIALPMALAFGVASGAGAASGLYGAVIVGFFAALFGGTPTLISEPTGPMTVVFTAVIAQLIASDPENGMAMAFTVVMLAGVFQIIFGLLKLGRYVTLMPYPVISGFMSGIGIILITLQLGPFLGHATPKGGVIGTLTSLPALVQTLDPAEVALGVFSLAVLFLVPKQLKRWVPPQLLVLVGGTLLALVLFPNADLRLIGEIPTGLPSLELPTFQASQVQTMLVNGLVLGMLGCIDALLTAMIADSVTRTQHDSNKELIGQGIGNLMSGLFGGMPGAGATMGTVVNIQAGGKTALSGLVRAGILLVVVLWAAPLTRVIPLAVLAGIAVKVGFDILDWSFLRRAHNVSWKGTAIMYGVMFLTVFVDLIVAVGVGVFIANMLTIDRLSKLQSEQVKIITDFDDDVAMSPEDKVLIDQANGRVLVFHLNGPMIFGVARAISQEHTAMDDHDILIVDLQDVPHLGVTAALALENAIQDASDAGRQVFVVVAQDKTLSRLTKLGALRSVPPAHLVATRTEALKASLTLLATMAGVEPPRTAVEPGASAV